MRAAVRALALSGVLAACGGGGGDPDLEPASAPSLRFVDGTAASGLGSFRQHNGSPEKLAIDESFAAGVALFDADGDGDLDAYLTNGSSPDGSVVRNAFFRNDGAGNFTDATSDAGLGDERWSYGVTAADHDGDGDVDLYITNHGPNRLYRNEGGGRFTDVAPDLELDDPAWSTGSRFFDYDRDGDLDLYVVNHIAFDRVADGSKRADFYDLEVYYGPTGLEPQLDRLFRREADGSYTDVSATSGIGALARFGFHALTFDWDRDGWPDLYVVNDSQANTLWRNRGDGTFEDVAPAAGVALSKAGAAQAGMGAALGDYDADGFEDLYVTNFSEDYFTLYKGSESGRYRDVTAVAGVYKDTLDSLGWGTFLEDLDGDGDVDLFAATGHVFPQVDQLGRRTGYLQRNLIFENVDGGRFRLPPSGAGPGLDVLAASRGAAFGDVDADGDPDLLVGNLDGPPTLLLNESGGRWVRILLDGNAGAMGIGAVVEARLGERALRRTVGAGDGFLSSSDPAVWFGVGAAAALEDVSVHWPDGRVDEVGDVPAGHAVTVAAGGGPAPARKMGE